MNTRIGKITNTRIAGAAVAPSQATMPEHGPFSGTGLEYKRPASNGMLCRR